MNRYYIEIRTSNGGPLGTIQGEGRNAIEAFERATEHTYFSCFRGHDSEYQVSARNLNTGVAVKFTAEF